jgi:hypothetical protein
MIDHGVICFWELRGFIIGIDLWACKILMSMDCESLYDQEIPK